MLHHVHYNRGNYIQFNQGTIELDQGKSYELIYHVDTVVPFSKRTKCSYESLLVPRNIWKAKLNPG